MILHAIVTTTQQNSFPHICVKPFDPSQKNRGDMAAIPSDKIAGESMPYRPPKMVLWDPMGIDAIDGIDMCPCFGQIFAFWGFGALIS